MTLENTLLAYARPHVMAVRARAVIAPEAVKGCQALIASVPVALEPPYRALVEQGEVLPRAPEDPWTVESPITERDLVRLNVWIDPNQKCDWNRSERFLKYLGSAAHRVGLEIVGNCKQISMQLLCHCSDAPVVKTAFLAEFELCRLSQRDWSPLSSMGTDTADRIAFYDFFPPPPYSHLLTAPDELRNSPYSSVVTALSLIPDTGFGVYQVMFQPVSPDHDWHANVRRLYDLEYAAALVSGMPVPQRQAQQVPSDPLNGVSELVVTKAHNDKPFFAVAARVAVVAPEDAQSHLRALGTFANLIQSGGRPLLRVTETDFEARMSAAEIGRMFGCGLTYRVGFLANSCELTTFAHIPPALVTGRDKLPMKPLETLPPTNEVSFGTPLGHCDYAGESRPVCIPPDIRTKHTHLIGKTGAGKSSLMERMVLYDIAQREGVAVLDPHGELVTRLLKRIPREHVSRVIYANPGDPKHVLIWNPLKPPAPDTVPGLSIGRIADDIVKAFKSFVDGWGDRLEHLLRNSISAVMRLPNGTLRDVADLLRRQSSASERLQQAILERLDDVFDRQFWIEDFPGYNRADIHPPQHKLSKLLACEPVRRMLSQPDSLFNLREVMDSGKILLVDLSSIGSETRDVLGCFILSLLHLAALSRSNAVGQYKQFHIYCDEAHRFMTDAMEDLIAETRKFGVSLTLAHQYLGQFVERKVGALSNVGATVVFDVDGRDAQYLLKDLLGKVEVEDLVGQRVGHAIARIGHQVVRLETEDRSPLPEDGREQEVIEESHRLYYRPVNQIPQQSGATELTPPSLLVGEPSSPGEFAYDTFD